MTFSYLFQTPHPPSPHFCQSSGERGRGRHLHVFREVDTRGVAAPNNFTLERAHRVGQKREVGAPPRTMIMKFLNNRDKVAVLRAARAKKETLYKGHPVQFYPDLAAGIHQKQREFDGVRQKLHNTGIRHDILVPARLVVTYKGIKQTFRGFYQANPRGKW